MSTLRRFAFTALLFAMPCSHLAFAQGGPPMLTDDPGTPGDGHLEANIAATLASTHAQRSWELPDVDLNYGVGDDIQLNLETSLAMLRSGGSSRWGLGATSLAMKWRFMDQDRSGISMSIYPRVERAIFVSSTRRGLADPGTQVLLPVQAARQYGRVGIDAEVGSLLSSAARSRWIYGVVGGVTIDSGTELMAELHGEALSRFEDHSMIANIGVRRRMATNLEWIGSIGHAVGSHPEDAPTWIAYAGIQWLH